MSEDEIEKPKRSRSASESIPLLVYFKSVVLTTLIIIAGMAFYTYQQKPKKALNIKESPTLNALATLKNQIQTFEKEDVASIAAKQNIQHISNQILGEVTKQTDSAIEKGVEKTTDYFYEHTVEQMIIALLERLPERQQKLILQRMCKSQ